MMGAEIKPIHTALEGSSVLQSLLSPLLGLLSGEGVNEVKIIEPGVALTLQNGAHVAHHLPEMTFARLKTLAETISHHSHQQLSEQRPILSASLPGGQRVQVVIPPAVPTGKISITIRVPDAEIRTLESYMQAGAFDDFVWAAPADYRERLSVLSEEDRGLVHALLDRDLVSFFKLAVLAKKTLGVVGDTGSGKTSLMKCLCQLIPESEYLITIEDVREILLPKHYASHLLYSKGAQGVAKVSPADLIASCMRMSPSRVLPAELRGSEAWDLLKLLTSGHSGPITTWHASCCSIAPERFVLMAKEHVEAGTLTRTEIRYLVDLTFDVYVHMTAKVQHTSGVPRVKRYITEVAFNPWTKQSAQFGANVVHRRQDEQLEMPA